MPWDLSTHRGAAVRTTTQHLRDYFAFLPRLAGEKRNGRKLQPPVLSSSGPVIATVVTWWRRGEACQVKYGGIVDAVVLPDSRVNAATVRFLPPFRRCFSGDGRMDARVASAT